MRRAGLVIVLVLGAIGCAHSHQAPAPSSAQRASDSLSVVISAACPGAGDSTAPWQRVLARWHDEPGRVTWSNDSLRRVLLTMRDTDQAIRFKMLGRESDTTLKRRMRDIDAANDRQIEAMIARYGWPRRSLVGASGESAAWLIVQHADTNLQRRGLALILAVPAGEVSQTEVAYLTDRVRTRANEPQLFGTQFDPLPDSGWVLHPIEDEAHVEARRASAGIEPLNVYLCTMRVMEHTRVLRHS